jgi:hypothetical protein
MVYDPQTGGYIDAALAAQRVPGYARAAATAVKGVPFAGEYADEILGALSGQVGQTEVAREMQSQFAEEHPVATPVMQIGTGIAAAAPLAVAGPIMKGAGLLQKGAAGMAAGAGLGAAEGAVAGYGAGEGEGRGAEAMQRGLVGGALGGTLGAAAPVLGSGIRRVGEWFADRPLKAAATQLGVSPSVARVIKSISEATDEGAAQKVLDTAGGDTFLADLSPAARGVLDTVMQSHSGAGQIAQEAITTRVAGAGSRLASTLDDVMGSPQGRGALSADIRGGAREVTSAAYDTAYRTPIDYTTEAGEAIEELMGRIPAKKLSAAIENANDMLRYQGIKADQILIDEAGKRTGLMNVAQLDFLKRSFDQVKRAGTDPVTGKLTPDALFAGQVASDIRKATRAASPAYSEALGLSADTLGREAATDFGARLMMPKMTRDIAARELRDMTDPEKAAAALGVRSYIDDTLANVRRTLTDPDVEPRQVQKLIGDLSSEASRKKLVLLLGGDKAKQVISELDRASIAMNLRAATVANSRTFGRETTKQALDAAMSGNPVLNALKSGNPIASGQQAIRAMTGMTDDAIEARKSGLYAEVASALVNIRGDDAMKALRLMRSLDVNAPIPKARANSIAKALTPFWVAGQQERTRALTEDQ